MEDIAKQLIDKISSYNLLNNFLSGLVFCCLIEKYTRFSFSTDEAWKTVFLYYFVGMIISRIGSLLVEKVLKSIKVKSKREELTKEPMKESFIRFAPYEDYTEASKNDSFLLTLNETNNLYRTFVAVFAVALIVKLYDLLLYNIMNTYIPEWDSISFAIMCIFMIIIFAFGYRKQTGYIRQRVEKYTKEKQDTFTKGTEEGETNELN